MKYYGIKTPDRDSSKPYIWWFATTVHDAWISFFKYPSKDGEIFPHTLPLGEAIKAYQSIGYKCVEVDVVEK